MLSCTIGAFFHPFCLAFCFSNCGCFFGPAMVIFDLSLEDICADLNCGLGVESDIGIVETPVHAGGVTLLSGVGVVSDIAQGTNGIGA